MLTFYHRLDLTCDSHHAEDKADAIEVGNSQLVLALLRGWTPVISQTQAFDTATILGSATGGPGDGIDFRELIRAGHLQIALYEQPSIADAFKAKLNNKEYVFACWPEITSRDVDRKELIESLINETVRPKLPTKVEQRIEAILAVDSARRQSHIKPTAKRPKRTLSSLLGDAAKQSRVMQLEVTSGLESLVSLGSDEWSVCYKSLQAGRYSLAVHKDALAILNICYDSVLADSLQVSTCGILSSRPSAFRVAQGMLTEAYPSSAYQLDIHTDDEIANSEMRDLRQVCWGDIRDFLSRYGHLAPDDVARQGLAARLIAEVATEEGGRLAVWPAVADAVYKVALCTAPLILAPFVGGAAGYIAPLTHLAPVVAVFAPVQKHVKNSFESRLTKKYFSLLSTTTERHVATG